MVRKPEVQFKQQEGGKLYMSELRAGAGSKRPVFVIPDPVPKNKRLPKSKPAPAIPTLPVAEPKEIVPPVPHTPEKPPTLCGRWMNGIRGKMACCGCKPHNLSEVQLIDENAGKKRGSTLTSQSQASTLQQQAAEKPSAFRKLCCCCCPNYGMGSTAGDNTMGSNRGSVLLEKKPWWRSACCSGGNKVRDSNATMMSGAGTPAWKRPLACCCGRGAEERRRREWADRRDSILSQPQPTKWWRRICCCGASSAAAAAASRRTSLFSKKRSLSQAVPLEQDKRPKLDASLVEHTSHLRGAIPALPVPLAWICFICNLLIPGLGTVCSGLFCLCFGRPRFGVYDGYRQRIGAFMIDVLVGIGQLFTVLFCLVGWGWSIWWATIMLKVARKYRKLKKTAANAERNGIPTTTNNHRSHPA